MDDDDNLWMTAEEVADYLRLSKSALRRLVHLGRLPPPVYDSNGRNPCWLRAGLDKAMGVDPKKAESAKARMPRSRHH
jgi:excisionase family DNA binding protein